MQPLFQALRQTIVSFGLIGEQSVTANFWRVQEIQKGRSRRLLLVRNIRMPAHTAISPGKERIELAGGSISVNDMKLGVSFWTSTRWMDVMTAEISSKVKSFLKWKAGKILIAECDDLALCDEERKLVFAGVGELAELNTSDFGTSCWGEFLNFAAFWEEISEGWICIEAMLLVDELFKCEVLLAMVPCWKVCGELRRVS